MPLVARAVAFDSVGFLPGFPSDSAYQCDPWSTSRKMGGCADAPQVVGREAGTSQAGAAIARAIAEARGGSATVNLGGCGCGGSCGGCGSHEHGLGDYGIPALSDVTGDPVGYLRSNAFPIVLGALAVYLIKKR